MGGSGMGSHGAPAGGVEVNGKKIVHHAIAGALGAAKGNAGNMSSLKIKVKFDNGKDGKSRKSSPNRVKRAGGSLGLRKYAGEKVAL